MQPSVFNNSFLTKKDIKLKYTNKLISMGDKISNSQKFGVNNTVDKVSFIKIKNLLPFVDELDNINYNNCINNYAAKIINKFNTL
jgi:hypothetical protein